METQYARDQPQGFKNRIEKVAIVGVGGQIGSFFTSALLKTGNHQLTAITRADSTSKIPEGVHVAKVNYSDPSAIVAALKGQDCLIITMSVQAPPENQIVLIEAAAEAGVPWVFPNEYGGDPTQTQMLKDTMLGPGRDKVRAKIEELGKSKWIAFICSFWYEYSLTSNPVLYGFDFKNRAVTFYDEGEQAINTTTWPQCGRAMASLLSLNVLPEDDNDKSTTLSTFAKKPVYISSFCISQKDMFESVLRVTGDKREDWSITKQPAKKRYEEGQAELRTGNRVGFGKMLYARSFYAGDEANYEKRLGTQNEVLGLPKEDLDEVTKGALKKMEEGSGSS